MNVSITFAGFPNIWTPHYHVYVSTPPSLSVSKFVQFVKGATSRKLQLEFEGLRKKYWGQHIWARRYFVATAGNVTDDMIQQYIKNQHKGTTDDEDFKITSPI